MSINILSCGSSDPNAPHRKTSQETIHGCLQSDWNEGSAWLVEIQITSQSIGNTPVNQHLRKETRGESVPEIISPRAAIEHELHLMRWQKDYYRRTLLSGNIKSLKLV